MSDHLEIEGGARLAGTVGLPGDKSISHRAVLLAARAISPSRLTNLSTGADLAASRRLAERLGAHFDTDGPSVLITPGGPTPSSAAVDCANSGTTVRLGAGLLAGRAGTTVLSGDASLSARPMNRVTRPLSDMGARILDTQGRCPLTIEGARLRGGEIRTDVPSAQVKGAILFAALDANGPTTVVEPIPTRRHTEELMVAAGVRIDQEPGVLRVHPGQVDGLVMTVPADPSAAAFWVVAACICPGSRLRAESVYLGPGRDGFLNVLRRMGADVEVVRKAEGDSDVEAAYRPLSATVIDDPSEVAACIDELPALMVAAATAEGTTVLRNSGELRVKESDRIAETAKLLKAFGVAVEVYEDGMEVRGGRLTGAAVDSRGDHRIAMAAAVAGMAATGTSKIRGWSAVAVSDPGFTRVLADVRIPT